MVNAPLMILIIFPLENMNFCTLVCPSSEGGINAIAEF